MTEGVAGWMLVAFHSRFAVETTDDVDSKWDTWLCGAVGGCPLSLYGDKGVDEELSGLLTAGYPDARTGLDTGDQGLAPLIGVYRDELTGPGNVNHADGSP